MFNTVLKELSRPCVKEWEKSFTFERYRTPHHDNVVVLKHPPIEKLSSPPMAFPIEMGITTQLPGIITFLLEGMISSEVGDTLEYETHDCSNNEVEIGQGLYLTWEESNIPVPSPPFAFNLQIQLHLYARIKGQRATE